MTSANFATQSINFVEPSEDYSHGISMDLDYKNQRQGLIDRVKKSFPNYQKEVDELFTKRSALDRISFTTVGKLKGLDTVSVANHELTHSIVSAAERSSQGLIIFDPDKPIDELEDFQNQVNSFFYDRSTETEALKKQKLLKVGDEALDISTYSRRIEDKLFNILSPLAAEEARANTGSNLLTRLSFGKYATTQLDDAYSTIGGFSHYLDAETYADSLLRKHPLFGQQEVEFGDRGAKMLKPMEDFPELLEQFGEIKKEISLRVDMRASAEYFGQLGELGGGFSTGSTTGPTKGIQSVLGRNFQEIFDRAYAIDGDLEKAFGYLTEYGENLSRVSQESKGVGISVSTLPELGRVVRTKNITRC